MAASGFVQAAGSPDIYQVLGNGVLDRVSNAQDFASRGGTSNDQIQQVNSLNDAYTPDIQAQANAQVDPVLASTTDALNAEKGTDQSSAAKTLQALQQTFAQRAQADPYGRAGIVSGQANAQETQNEGNQVSAVGDDLSAKLSDIAQRLGTAQTSAAAQKAGLVSTLGNTFANNNQSYQAAKQAALTASSKVSPVDLGGSVAFVTPSGQLVGQLSKSSAPTSGDSSAFSAELAALLGGNTATPTTQTPTASTTDSGNPDDPFSVAWKGSLNLGKIGSTNPQGSTLGVQGGSTALQGGAPSSNTNLQAIQDLLSNAQGTISVKK